MKNSLTANTWKFSHGSSTHLDQNLVFVSSSLNVTHFCPRYFSKNRRVERNLAGCLVLIHFSVGHFLRRSLVVE